MRRKNSKTNSFQKGMEFIAKENLNKEKLISNNNNYNYNHNTIFINIFEIKT
jgi:hypothetical protein